MKQEYEKAPRWLWKIALFVLVLGILVLVVSRTSLPKSSFGGGSLTSTLAEKPSETCRFPKGQSQITVAIEPGKWSCWIVTPVGTDYRIDTSVDADICFADDWCDLPLIGRVIPSTSKHIDDNFNDVGIRRGVFQILGHEKGLATITIKSQ